MRCWVGIANRFGVAAATFAVLAVVASVVAMTMPYRLTPLQRGILETAMLVNLLGPLFAIGFGSAAMHGDARSRRLGYVAIWLSVVAIVLGFSANHVHSM